MAGMWCLRDYNDEVMLGKRTFTGGPNHLEKVIAEGLDGITF